MRDMRLLAFVAALFVYALLGSPTPDSPGIVEGLVGGLLVLAAGFGGAYYALRISYGEARWVRVGRVFLVYGLIGGVFMAFLAGQDVRLIARDVIPFLFLFMPLFFYPFLAGLSVDKKRVVVVACLAVGVGFSVRASAGVLPFSVPFEGDSLYYLGNSPLVLFSALLCAGVGFVRLSGGLGARRIMQAVLLFAVAGLCALPLALAVQRASLGVVAVYVVLAVGVVFMRAPRRVILMLVLSVPILGVVLSVYSGPLLHVLGDVVDSLMVKNARVGSNMRFAEWAAVWAEVTASPLHFLFGQGWGASFSSPAVADIRVNYTHSLVSAMLLKIGVVGMVACAWYLYALGRRLLEVFGARPLWVMALAAPIMIDVFLYAAYKSLDFGLILLLVTLYARENTVVDGGGSVASKGGVLYAKGDPVSPI